MARSIDEIYEAIVVAKEGYPQLDILNSSSRTSVWRLWAFVTATAIHTVERLYDLLKVDIVSIITSKNPGSQIWYRNIALDFRYGATLMVDELGKPYYPPFGIAGSSLIAACSVVEVDRGIVMKVAKKEDGQFSGLSSDELAAFTAYLHAVKYAGTHIRIITAEAVKLSVQATLYYDPQTLTPDGELIVEKTAVVPAAIEAYLRKLPFDGRLTRNALIEAILQAPGINDVRIDVLSCSFEGESSVIDVYHLPESGYFKLDQLNISYVAYV